MGAANDLGLLVELPLGWYGVPLPFWLQSSYRILYCAMKMGLANDVGFVLAPSLAWCGVLIPLLAADAFTYRYRIFCRAIIVLAWNRPTMPGYLGAVVGMARYFNFPSRANPFLESFCVIHCVDGMGTVWACSRSVVARRR